MNASLDPTTLDHQAAELYHTAAWQAVVDGWHTTAPEPTPPPAGPRPARVVGADLVTAVPGLLLTRTTDQLIADAGIRLGPARADRELPGRLAAALPDRLHAWRRLYQPDLKPSIQLGYARLVLQEWGWQNQPYRLRDARGARCVCGAILTAHRLGRGSHATAQRSAAYVLGELRRQGWTDLIGPWNRAPGRTATHATDLLESAARTAAQQGH